MPIYVPEASGLITNVIQWFVVDTDGNVHDLTWQVDKTIFVPKGTKGLGVPRVDLQLEKLPFSPGSKLRYIKTLPTEIELPIVISKPTMIEAMIAAENVRSWFYTGNERENSPAFLRITRPQDNLTRQIAVYYNGGLEGDMEDGSPNYIPYVISLLAPDPVWTDTENIEIDYDQGELGNVQVITNPGDFDAYPIYTLVGPISGEFAITNIGLNRAIIFGNITVLAGESITIDTRPPTERTTLPVIDQDGVSLYSELNTSSTLELWLSPGANQYRFTVNGASANTNLHIEYLPRYLGVLR